MKMKLKTKIIRNIPKPSKKREVLDNIFNVWLFTLTIFFNNFLPFVFGYYFAWTRNFMFLVLAIMLVLFNIEMEYTKGKLNIKVIKNV